MIAPANFFNGKEGQLAVITLLNCVYMSSAVIPMLLIAMRFFQKNWQVVITLVTVVVMPTISMTMTFMSENIYFPLCIWNFYCCIAVMEQTKENKKIIGSVLVGILNYLLYLNKEIALAFFIAYMLMEAKEALTDKNKRRLIVFGLAAASASFGICFLLMKLTIFSGMGNSYHQMSIDAIASMDRFCFMLYAMMLGSKPHFFV